MTTFDVEAQLELSFSLPVLTWESLSATMLQHEGPNNPVAEVIRSRGASPHSRKSSNHVKETNVNVNQQKAATALASPVTSSGEDQDHDHPKFKPNARFYLAFLAISSLTLAAALDATSLSIALPALTRDLGGDAIQSFWTGTAFFLASSIIMPIFAALSHIFGRKMVRSTTPCDVLLTPHNHSKQFFNGYRLTDTSARSLEHSFSWPVRSWALWPQT